MKRSIPMASPVTDRVRKHREALRQAGLKPVQLWLPDTRATAFRRKCGQESLLAAADPNEAKVLRWIERAADLEGWK
jgi:hypothetical protein